MNSAYVSLQVPANLILFGEYFISIHGNQALCLAPHRYATLTIRPHSSNAPPLVLESKYAHHTHVWQHPRECALYDHAKTCFDIHKAQYHDRYQKMRSHKASVLPWTSHDSTPYLYASVDSNDFFHPHTTHKLGLGSSEASTVLYCALILIEQGINPTEEKDLLAHYASLTHHSWQKKRGSGYGIFTSIYGGAGIYTNNEHATWEEYHLPSSLYFYYLQGNMPISSPDSLSSFLQWKDTYHDEWYALYTRYLHHMRTLHTEHNFLSWIHIAKDIGLTLGSHIGVSAHITAPHLPSHTNHTIEWKATGAGNENAVGIADFVIAPQEASAMNISSFTLAKGIHWI